MGRPRKQHEPGSEEEVFDYVSGYILFFNPANWWDLREKASIAQQYMSQMCPGEDMWRINCYKAAGEIRYGAIAAFIEYEGQGDFSLHMARKNRIIEARLIGMPLFPIISAIQTRQVEAKHAYAAWNSDRMQANEDNLVTVERRRRRFIRAAQNTARRQNPDLRPFYPRQKTALAVAKERYGFLSGPSINVIQRAFPEP